MTDLLDNEGFLINLKDWSPTLAETLAKNEGIVLSEAHWALINEARAYYNAMHLSPEMRPFIKWIARHYDPQKANSIYLLRLFPGSPAKLISKIAGLPKPTNCL